MKLVDEERAFGICFESAIGDATTDPRPEGEVPIRILLEAGWWNWLITMSLRLRAFICAIFFKLGWWPDDFVFEF